MDKFLFEGKRGRYEYLSCKLFKANEMIREDFSDVLR